MRYNPQVFTLRFRYETVEQHDSKLFTVWIKVLYLIKIVQVTLITIVLMWVYNALKCCPMPNRQLLLLSMSSSKRPLAVILMPSIRDFLVVLSLKFSTWSYKISYFLFFMVAIFLQNKVLHVFIKDKKVINIKNRFS